MKTPTQPVRGAIGRTDGHAPSMQAFARRAATTAAMTAAVLVLASCGGSGDPPPADPPEVKILTEYEFWSRQAGDDWTSEGKDSGYRELPLEVDIDWGPSEPAQTYLGQPNAASEVFTNNPATATGDDHTFWLRTDSPLPSQAAGKLGSAAWLRQTRRLQATNDAPTYRLTITAIELEAWDGSACSAPTNCTLNNYAEATLKIKVVRHDTDASGNPRNTLIFDRGGVHMLAGSANLWQLWTENYEQVAGKRLPDLEFDFETTPLDANPDPQRHARYRLSSPIVVDLPLGGVKAGNEFSVVTESEVRVSTVLPESFYRAYYRDPAGGDGVTVETTGTTPILAVAVEPIEAPEVPACNGAPDPEAGVLQFTASTVRLDEGDRTRVEVVRTGGTRGLVSATLRTLDGTAVGGQHYRSIERTLRFGDGETGPLPVLLEAIDNASFDRERGFMLELTDPRGCATLAQPSTVGVTIVEDETPTFAIGGSVTGLVGTGLVLENLGSSVAMNANGTFTFPQRWAAAIPYDVRVHTQPSNPTQSCRVANGSGTIAADVTNVTVTCDPPVTPPGGSGFDASFGTGGSLTRSGVGQAVSMVQQADGKLVVLTDFAKLLRLNADGSPDTAFGTNGVVDATLSGSALDLLRKIALQADGGILLTGIARGGAGDDMGVRRYRSDGTVDTTFGTAGLARVDFFGQADDATALVVQPDGRIALTGVAVTATLGSEFAFARLLADGTLDAGFATGGKRTVNFGSGTEAPAAVALQPDGRIVVAGRAPGSSGGSTPDTALVRLTPDGALDASFGNGGSLRIALTTDWDEATDLVVQPDGKLLLSLEARTSAAAPYAHMLARLEADGAVDVTFGAQGVVRHAFASGGDHPRALVLLPDGRIVTAGFGRFGSSSLTDDDMLITRHLADGSLDTSFGDGGKLVVDFFAASDSARTLLRQADGRIVAAGLARNGATSDNGLGIVRLLP